MRSPFRTWLALVAVFVLLLGACSFGDDDDETGTPATSDDSGDDANEDEPAEEPDTGVAGGVLELALPEESDGWFPPTASWGPAQFWVGWSIFDPLMMTGPDGSIRPFLAESMEPSGDFTQWTLTLRGGIEFHDGTPLDAETLVRNFELLQTEELPQGEGTSAGNLEGISIEAVDDLTVVYTLPEANASFPGLLTTEAGAPFSMAAVDEFGADAAANPVGTGPFRFVSWTLDDRLEVERNESYWQAGLPHADAITFRVLPDEVTRVAALEAGDVDAIFTSNPRSIAAIQQNADVTTHLSAADNNTFAIVYNVNLAPTDDLRVRRALTHAIDQDGLIAVRGGDGVLAPATQPYDPGSPWFSQAAADAYPAHDVEAARALIDEYVNDPSRSDGKAVGEPVSLVYEVFPNPDDDATHLALVDMWQAAGIEVVYQPYADDTEWLFGVLGTFEGDTPFAGSFQVTAFAYEVGAADPTIPLAEFFEDATWGIVNIADYQSDAVIEALGELRSSSDPDVRRAAVEAISLALAEDLPHGYAGNTRTAIGALAGVEGIDSWVFPSGEPGTGSPLGVPMWGQVQPAG